MGNTYIQHSFRSHTYQVYIYKQVYISFLWETPTYSTASEATLIIYIYIKTSIYIISMGNTYIQHSFRSHAYQVYISFLWEIPTYSTASEATLIIYIYIKTSIYIISMGNTYIQHSFRSHAYHIYIYINKYIYHFYGKHLHTAQLQKPHLSSIYIYINKYIYHFYGKHLHTAQLQKPHLSSIYIQTRIYIISMGNTYIQHSFRSHTYQVYIYIYK